MNVKLRVLSAGVLFFIGHSAMAQKVKKDTTSTKEIEEVVVVGFGQKKTVQEMTGSASTMTSKAIEDVPVASVDKMLQGRVSGVQTGQASGQPGGFANVRVRGVSSINGVTSPIYIVDGVRIASGDLTKSNTTANILANMNPDDIESITVLKDAVSTAVYGADAGAGVIVITTKSGKRGKTRFNFSFNSGFNQQAVESNRGFTGEEYKIYLRDAVNNYLGSNYTIEDIANGKVNATFANIFKSPYSTDWQSIVRKEGYQQNADFNLSGGNDKFTYYASANMFEQNSIVRNSFFKRLSYTTKLTYQATEKLKISTDFQISHGKTRTLPDAGGFANPMLAQFFNRPTDQARNPDGSWYWNPIHGDGYNYGGYKRESVNRFFNFNVQNILDYRFKLADVNNFAFSLIQEAYKRDNKFLRATRITTGAPTLETLSNFVVPYNGIEGTQDNTSRYGYAITGHYDYDKLFLIDASYRRDVLSQFVPGKKAGNFWSVGVALDLARINYFKEINAISMMKFRASYGKLGNQVSANPYALYSYTTNYNDLAAATYSGVFNPNLSWETVNPLNIGLDLGFFKDRLKITAEYYNKKTKDLIYNLPLSPSQGLTSYVDNIGDLVNKGFEFSVNADIFRGDRDQFNWTLGFNLSTLKNEITKLYGGTVNGNTTTIREGEGVRTFYLRKWAGVDPANGDPLWYVNGVDGETTNDYNKARQAVQGSFLSNVFGGANTTLSYKGFALDLQFTYGFGGKIYDNWSNYTYSDGQYSINYPGYGDVMGNYWTPTNTNAANPKPVYGGNKLSNSPSTRYLYKGDFIRLSNARFGYTFDSKFLQGSGLNSVQVYVMANNAWTHMFDKNLKFDPEVNIAGYTDLSLPVLKSYLLGVNISF